MLGGPASPAGDGVRVVRFAEPQRRVAAGQSVVLYEGDEVVGGGGGGQPGVTLSHGLSRSETLAFRNSRAHRGPVTDGPVVPGTPGDGDDADPPPPRRRRGTAAEGHPRRWVVLGVMCLSLLLIVVDNTIVNVALPTLQQDLDATTSQLQWIVDSYILVFAGLLLTMGSLGDRFGRKGALAIGLVDHRPGIDRLGLRRRRPTS